VPAAELEDVAVAGLKSLLAEPTKIAEVLKTIDIPASEIGSMIKKAYQVSAIVGGPDSPQCRANLHQLISKIAIGKHEMTISIKAKGLAILLDGKNGSIVNSVYSSFCDSQAFELNLPLQLRHRGVETRLVLLAQEFGAKPVRDPALISLIARAYAWAQELMTDPTVTVGQISKREKVTMSYVSRVTPLGFLAPNILEAILSGTHSSENTAKQLAMHLDVPLCWSEQEKSLNR
jgi:hypothetical protein